MSKEKLKTKYKFIHFIEGNADTKWKCCNNRDYSILGTIEYYPRWKQYVIEFTERCVFNNQCLKDIADFLKDLNRRAK